MTVHGAATLPASVVTAAVMETNISRRFTPQAADDFAALVNGWYASQGYLASRVLLPIASPTEASNRLVVRVSEGMVAPEPVAIHYFRPRWVDCNILGLTSSATSNHKKLAYAVEAAEKTLMETSSTEYLGRRVPPLQRPTKLYPNSLQDLRVGGPGGSSQVDARSFNGTHVRVFERVSGRTSPSTVASALDLRPGRPFRLTHANTLRLLDSGLFRDISWRALSRDGSSRGGTAPRVDHIHIPALSRFRRLFSSPSGEGAPYPSKHVPSRSESTSVVLSVDVIEHDSYVYFEPGVKSNLADKSMDGTIEFKHMNFFGRNQRVSAMW